jgi:uncharacterized integral membrane protein
MDNEEYEEIPELEEADAPSKKGRAPIGWGVVLGVIWAVALVIFSVQNAGSTSVEFLAWQWQMPVAVLVMFSALATLALTLVGLGFRRRKLKRLQRDS